MTCTLSLNPRPNIKKRLALLQDHLKTCSGLITDLKSGESSSSSSSSDDGSKTLLASTQKILDMVKDLPYQEYGRIEKMVDDGLHLRDQVTYLEQVRDGIVRAMEVLMALGFSVAAVRLSPHCPYNTGTHIYI